MLISLTLFINNKQETIEVDYNENEHYLKLSCKNITSLKGVVFPQTLRTLDIINNKLTSLEGISSLESLVRLDISHNSITSLKDLPRTLENLYISHNSITSLEGISSLESLVRLDISHNLITSLEGFPRNLDKLWIFRNKITSLEGLSSLERLTLLNIADNQITSLEGLSSLESLTELDISHNSITSLEGLPQTLEHLLITHNSINSLEGLPSLSRLTYLNISNNKITSLEGFSRLERLTVLYIWNNKITELPIEIVHSRNLRSFYYDNNPIENIHASVQRFLNALRNRDTRTGGHTIYNDGQNVHNMVNVKLINHEVSFTNYTLPNGHKITTVDSAFDFPRFNSLDDYNFFCPENLTKSINDLFKKSKNVAFSVLINDNELYNFIFIEKF